jgi:hypothetical protein
VAAASADGWFLSSADPEALVQKSERWREPPRPRRLGDPSFGRRGVFFASWRNQG